jgi:Rod binding domain-containing protein
MRPASAAEIPEGGCNAVGAQAVDVTPRDARESNRSLEVKRPESSRGASHQSGESRLLASTSAGAGSACAMVRQSSRRRQSRAEDGTPEQHAAFAADVVEALAPTVDRLLADLELPRTTLTTYPTHPRAGHTAQSDAMPSPAAPCSLLGH